MSKWVHFNKDWFNFEDFCHIWIETKSYHENKDGEYRIIVTGYYAMGEWRHSGEEVIITQDFDSIEDLVHYLNRKLDIK